MLAARWDSYVSVVLAVLMVGGSAWPQDQGDQDKEKKDYKKECKAEYTEKSKLRDKALTGARLKHSQKELDEKACKGKVGETFCLERKREEFMKSCIERRKRENEQKVKRARELYKKFRKEEDSEGGGGEESSSDESSNGGES